MSRARHCPVCNSNNVDYTRFEFDKHENRAIAAYGFCHDCKEHFIEWYKTEFVGSVPYKDNPYEGPLGAPVSRPEAEVPDVHEMRSLFEKTFNEALDMAEAVTKDLRERRNK